MARSHCDNIIVNHNREVVFDSRNEGEGDLTTQVAE